MKLSTVAHELVLWLSCANASIHFGCSHCLAVAIESHNLSLVDELLRRPVVYRDMFWALIPATWRSYDRSIPMRISEDEHLTLVGQPNCGHESFEMDLCTPILSAGLSTQILVSLPIRAQWHWCAGFPVEQLLRASHKFELGEPQFYHLPVTEAVNSHDARNGLNLLLRIEIKGVHDVCRWTVCRLRIGQCRFSAAEALSKATGSQRVAVGQFLVKLRTLSCYWVDKPFFERSIQRLSISVFCLVRQLIDSGMDVNANCLLVMIKRSSMGLSYSH